MIPQIDNSLSNTTDLMAQNRLPGKTYKLIIGEANYVNNYYTKLITFKIENGDLFVTYPESETLDEFEIDDTDLIVESLNPLIEEKYYLSNDYLMLNADELLASDNADRIDGFTDKRDAIKQSIYHILMTERYAYLIYDNNYGIELNQYIGQGIEFLKASIENTLRSALLQDERITDISINEIQEINKDTALVRFSVDTIYNKIDMEVNVNV